MTTRILSNGVDDYRAFNQFLIDLCRIPTWIQRLICTDLTIPLVGLLRGALPSVNKNGSTMPQANNLEDRAVTVSGKKQLTFSVITPSYNQSEFLTDTLTSVQNQGEDLYEHLVIDGGSTDGTLEILRSFSKLEDYPLKWVSEPDRGQAHAVNKGFAMSSGDLIGWLNSDDFYLFDSTLATVKRVFEAHPHVDVVYGDVALVNSQNELLRIVSVPSFRFDQLLDGCFIEQPALFLRARVVKQYKLNESLDYAMDYEYWLRLASQGLRFLHIPKVLAADRNHATRKILSGREKMMKEAQCVARSYGTPPRSRMYCRLLSGVPQRLRGLVQLMTFDFSRALLVRLPSVPKTKTIYNQLIEKSRNLV